MILNVNIADPEVDWSTLMFTLLLNKVFNQFVSLTLFTCTKIVPAFVLNLKYTPNYKPLCLSVVGIIMWYNKINPNKFLKFSAV